MTLGCGVDRGSQLGRLVMPTIQKYHASTVGSDLDEANDAPLALYIAEETTGANVLDRIMTSCGAAWYADSLGVFRFRRLIDPSENAVTAPSSLADAAWFGAGTYTDNYAVYDGISFSRIQGNGSTNLRRQTVQLASSGSKSGGCSCCK